MTKEDVVGLQKEDVVISSADIAFNYLKSYGESDVELFLCLTLDSGNYPICCHLISKGTVSNVVVHPREVFRAALMDNASGIIIAHNHTNRNLKPSDKDIDITNRLVECGEILGIPVCDHIIVTRNGFLSFKREGLIGQSEKPLKTQRSISVHKK